MGTLGETRLVRSHREGGGWVEVLLAPLLTLSAAAAHVGRVPDALAATRNERVLRVGRWRLAPRHADGRAVASLAPGFAKSRRPHRAPGSVAAAEGGDCGGSEALQASSPVATTAATNHRLSMAKMVREARLPGRTRWRQGRRLLLQRSRSSCCRQRRRGSSRARSHTRPQACRRERMRPNAQRFHREATFEALGCWRRPPAGAPRSPRRPCSSSPWRSACRTSWSP